MNIIKSASCSIEPDSRKSEFTGRLSARCSNVRLSWESAITGTSNSFANAFNEREISAISKVRLSENAGARIN